LILAFTTDWIVDDSECIVFAIRVRRRYRARLYCKPRSAKFVINGYCKWGNVIGTNALSMYVWHEGTRGVVTCNPLPPGFASNHLCAVVGPMDRLCQAFALPADGATHAFVSAAWTALTHRAGLHESSFYRL